MEEIRAFVASIDYVLTDCDGVLWKELTPIDGSAKVLSLLKSMGKKVFYVTNNSTKTREEYVSKFEKLGFSASKEEIVGTARIVATYLKDKNFTGKAYLIGSKGLGNELSAAGIDFFGLGPDPVQTDNLPEVFDAKFEKDVSAVVVGFDLHISYPKLLKAATFLSNPKCLFVATNTDEVFPAACDNTVPGTGTLVAAVETCSQRKAQIIGKPSTLMFSALAKEHNIDPKRAIMIGDRAKSDILFGKNVGMTTLLVYTGVNSKEDVEMWQTSLDPSDKLLIPDYTLDSLGDLLPLLENLTK
ncbi:glycerol-3-phosphate phosphatase-like [Artemia franciscana]|uniref:glycerol-3-phosphate phosphatase-like n=1 Tax=Artemia franciscana TaxID=6661 RepID=UPI0032DB30C0